MMMLPCAFWPLAEHASFGQNCFDASIGSVSVCICYSMPMDACFFNHSFPFHRIVGFYRSSVSIITKDMLVLPRPSLMLTMRLQPLQLLLDGLCLHLTMPRHTNIDCYSHRFPPVWLAPLGEVLSIAEGTGKLYPSGAGLASAPLADGGISIGVSSLIPPRC